MDTRPRIEEFLTLEATMQQVLDQLQQLREETESYSTARESLTVTVDRIGTLTEQLSSVAGEIQEVARTLREIGTPELLNRHDMLQEQLNDLLSNVEALRTQSTTSLQTIEQNHAGTIQAISDVGASSERSNQALDGLTSTVLGGVESLRQELSTQSAEIVQKAESLENTVNGLQERILDSEQALERRIRNLLIIMIVLTIIAVGVISAVFTLV